MASRSRMVAIGLAGVAVVALAGVAVAAPHPLNDWPYTGQTGSYTLATVGDIACEPDDAENAGTPAQLKCGSDSLGWPARRVRHGAAGDAMHPDAVALLGDEQYQVGKLSDFEQSFEQAWGGLKCSSARRRAITSTTPTPRTATTRPPRTGLATSATSTATTKGTPNAAGAGR